MKGIAAVAVIAVVVILIVLALAPNQHQGAPVAVTPVTTPESAAAPESSRANSAPPVSSPTSSGPPVADSLPTTPPEPDVTLPKGALTGAAYRALADESVAEGKYAAAATYYRYESAVYLQKGDSNAATVERMKADRWSTELLPFYKAPPNQAELLKAFTGSKYEPINGCYLSAYVENDNSLADSDGGGNDARVAKLGGLVGKLIASSWQYCRWGQEFPTEWASALHQRNIAPHIAWEPDRGLDEVRDDEYLRQFARDCKACSGPIFIRFAGEMNGDWTAYHADPALYQEKFRLVHDVMAQEAPNVAMIWCVNSLPDNNYALYYPGDAYVDWVGVNIYSVLHHDNDPSRPATDESPISLLRPVYAEYASRKPIAICEYGSSHEESISPGHDFSDVAATKLSSLLAALPRRFPRVKMIGLFDSDNLTEAYVQPGRQLNNYCVTDSPTVLTALQEAVKTPYYLSYVNAYQMASVQFYPLTRDATVPAPLQLSAWVHSYDLLPTVVETLDGREVLRSKSPDGHDVVVSPQSVSPGPHKLDVSVLDEQGRVAGSLSVPFRVAEGR